MPAGLLRSLAVVSAAVWVAAVPVRAAAQPAASGTVSTIDLPGGVEGIRRAIGDRRPTPAATIGVELARRFHGGTAVTAGDDPVLARLRAWLRTCQRLPACGQAAPTADRVPLPGDAAFWRDAVFDGRLVPEHLMLGILERREAAQLYTALLSMPEPARAWLLARPAIVRQLLAGDTGPLLVAAPYLEIAGDRWAPPGGAHAGPIWEALAGRSLGDPEAWLLAMLREHDGLLPYAMEVVATLSATQQRALLALGADERQRIAAGVELLDALRTAVRGWRVRERPFWRPSHDPAFLLAQLPVDGDALALPGGRAFWALMLGAADAGADADAVRAAWDDATPVTPAWLVARVWGAAPADQPIRYEQVLFAARRLPRDPAPAADALAVVGAWPRLPQLLRVLDRLDVADVPRLAAVVRRADALARAGTGGRARAAVIRWQAALSALDYMARLGALDADELPRALDALADASEPADRRGRLRAWLDALGVGAVEGDIATRSLETAVLSRLTRTRVGSGVRVAWEGESYRFDVGAAERDRLIKVRGRDSLPRLDAAWMALSLADAPAAPANVETVVTALVVATRLDRPLAADEDGRQASRAAAATARRLVGKGGAVRDWPAAQAALADLGEALATDAAAELAYALAMGWAEDLPLTAVAAFRRHEFERPSPAGAVDAAWLPAEIRARRGMPWHVEGSLLALDDTLAAVTLRRPSLRPLGAAPSLNTGDRRWLLSTVVALERARFTDDAQRQLAALVARGGERLQAVAGAAAAREAAALAGASPLRQAIAGWLADVDPAALPGVLSATDLARLGSDGVPLPDVLAGWGNAQGPISGRLSAGPLPPLPWERYAGRSARVVSSALPDLQLTLAVRLATRQLPAVLVPDLMPAAMFELIYTAAPRHADDFGALAEHVRLLDGDAVDRYVGLLTTAGPLRREPSVTTGESSAAGSDVPPPLSFQEPVEGAPVIGASRVTVAVPPLDAAVTRLVVTIDGRELCRLQAPPWSCAWDAGADMAEHHLRAVATLADDRRLVASRRTKGLEISDRVEVAAVQVPVIVTDAQGRFVRGLKREAFTLLEDGRPQRIDTIIDDTLPLELIAAIDISGSMTASMGQVQQAVKGLLRQLRGGDTTTLLGFNETVFVLAERESDTALRDAAVDALVPWGGTAFYDATVRSLDLVSQKAGRRGVVIFSDGDDRHSVGRRGDSLRRIEEGQVALYTVGFGEGASPQFRGTLQAFAEASGGRAFFPHDAGDLDSAFGAILEELSHQYILSYVSDAPRDGSWRRLEIRACDGCRVRAREGYRASDR